jgi:hypothetical protein
MSSGFSLAAAKEKAAAASAVAAGGGLSGGSAGFSLAAAVAKKKAAAAPKPVKILVSGDAKGQFKTMFDAVAKANAKAGPFEALFCVGTFFHPDGDHSELKPFLEGKAAVPIPTYFICGSEGNASTEFVDPLRDGGELCPNLHYLGRQGRKKIAGLEVCYLSGRYDETTFASDFNIVTRYDSANREEDVEELLVEGRAYNKKTGVDLLLTAEWGKGMGSLLKPDQIPLKSFQRLSPAVQRLCSEQISMQYHFAGTEGCFFQLPPYRNGTMAYPSRFYGLGCVGNKTKQRSLQALNVTRVKTPAELVTEEAERASQQAAQAKESGGATESAEVPIPVGVKKASANPYKVMHKTFAARMAEKAALESGEQTGEVVGTCPVTGKQITRQQTEASEGSDEALKPDPQHLEMDGGDWECGYCGNHNQHKRKQVRSRGGCIAFVFFWRSLLSLSCLPSLSHNLFHLFVPSLRSLFLSLARSLPLSLSLARARMPSLVHPRSSIAHALLL